MKFTVLQENFKSALKTLTKAVPSKPSLPILATILCSVTNGEVVLSATDLYLGITVRLPASLEEEGLIAIPGRTLIDTIASLSAGKLVISTETATLTIKASTTKSTIQCLEATEFPTFPEKEGVSLSIPYSVLKKVDDSLSFAVSTDQARLVLTTLLFQPTESGTEVVATDGFRLGKLSIPTADLSLEQPLLIAAQAISEVIKIAEQQEQKTIAITVSSEQKQLFFSSGDTTLYVRLVEGSYPPYQKIFPTVFETEIEVDGATLTEHIKQAQVFAREVSNVVTLQITDQSLHTVVQGAAQGSFTATIDGIQQKGPNTTISFNSRYLLDFLNKQKPTLVSIGLNDPLKPALFKSSDDVAFSYVVMPFRVNQG